MAKVIVVANQKGGVGKTTTTQALSAILKQRGNRVLAVDFDPQGNLTDSVGIDLQNEDSTAYELVMKEAEARDVIKKLNVFDLVAADIVLASSEQKLPETGRQYQLKEALEPVFDDYDYIVIDTPPSLGALTINSFTVADEVILTATAGMFAIKGIRELFETVKSVRKYYNPKLQIKGVLFTKYDPRKNNSKDIREVAEKLSPHIEAPVFSNYIRNRVAVDEAQARGVDILSYKECGDVVADYNAFVDEYLEGSK